MIVPDRDGAVMWPFEGIDGRIEVEPSPFIRVE